MNFFALITHFFLLAFMAVHVSAQENPGVESLATVITQLYRIKDDEAREQFLLSKTKSDHSITDWLNALSRGPVYATEVETGKIFRSIQNEYGTNEYYTLIVPENYQATRQYPVVLFLHGGISRNKWRRNGKWWPSYRSVVNQEFIQIFPAAWNGSKWWHDHHLNTLMKILFEVRRDYNVDTNRIYATGVSDGGSGLFYLGSKYADQFAVLAPVIGSPSVLTDTKNGAESDTFPLNFRESPWWIVSAEKDSLYPADAMQTYVEFFQKLGATMSFHRYNGGHTYDAFLENWPKIVSFFKQHQRKPYPDHLVWQAGDDSPYYRHHFLVIEEVEATKKDSIFKGLMGKNNPRGIIELHVSGNRIKVQSYAIKKFRLLLSPQQFDLQKVITIEIDGVIAFQRKPLESLSTLLKWAAVDRDPERLYTVELSFDLAQLQADDSH